jgi:glycosyltransferase involved in cell wall biosynthesis
VVSGDVAELAAQLDRIVAERKVQREYGEAGRAYAEQYFRWERIASDVRRMYDVCLGAGNKNSEVESAIE